MKVFAFAIYDKSAESFGPPYFCRARGEGVRMFIDQVNRQGVDNLVGKHPEDFILFSLGTYDDNTGTFEQDESGPVKVMPALDAVAARTVM